MTTSRAWKQLEQWWAELHGEERSGPTGRDKPDCTHTNFPVGIECKFQERRCLRTKDIEQAKENAAKLELPWMLVLHTKDEDRTNDLVVLPVDTYLGILTGELLPANLPQSTYDLTLRLLRRYEK